MTEEVVLFSELDAAKGNKIGVAMLNSEKSLNALNKAMVDVLLSTFERWQQDASIMAVFLHGAGDKAFCAGGDVVALHRGSAAYGEALPDDSCDDFFTAEYRLDYLIHTYQKPIIVWGTGFVMGGGLGLLGGASYRVVTETTRMAMPEVTIGLYPDVGGTWFLNRTPGKTGLFLGLTGARINAADAKLIGLADHFITQDLKWEVLQALTEVKCERGIAGVMSHFSALAAAQEPSGQLDAHYDWINEVCTGDHLLRVIDQITAYDGSDPWCERAVKTLLSGCPITPFLVWEQLQRGKNLSLEEVFRLESTVSSNCARQGHFKEGVRALLVDKDGNPQWTPATFNEVNGAEVDAFFLDSRALHPLADL